MNVFASHLVAPSRRAVRRRLPQAIAAVSLFRPGVLFLPGFGCAEFARRERLTDILLMGKKGAVPNQAFRRRFSHRHTLRATATNRLSNVIQHSFDKLTVLPNETGSNKIFLLPATDNDPGPDRSLVRSQDRG
jgi:hypothetical protein